MAHPTGAGEGRWETAASAVARRRSGIHAGVDHCDVDARAGVGDLRCAGDEVTQLGEGHRLGGVGVPEHLHHGRVERSDRIARSSSAEDSNVPRT